MHTDACSHLGTRSPYIIVAYVHARSPGLGLAYARVCVCMCVYATQAKCINNNTLYTHTYTSERIYTHIVRIAPFQAKRARAHVKHSIESGWSTYAYACAHAGARVRRDPAEVAGSADGEGREGGMCERCARWHTHTLHVCAIFRKVKDKECNPMVDEVNARCYGDGVRVCECIHYTGCMHMQSECNIILNRQRAVRVRARVLSAAGVHTSVSGITGKLARVNHAVAYAGTSACILYRTI